MMFPDYEQRTTINQALKLIEKEIGKVDPLIKHKKLNLFQKIHNFMTKPINIGRKK